jgi:hypothetical protein
MYTKHDVLEDVLRVLQNGEKLAYKMIALECADGDCDETTIVVKRYADECMLAKSIELDGGWDVTLDSEEAENTIHARYREKIGATRWHRIGDNEQDLHVLAAELHLVWGEDPDADDEF